MYNIILTYVKSGGIVEVEFPYIVTANSYEEAVAWVQVEADKRLEKMGGTIISIV
jgi:hypothetical protein